MPTGKHNWAADLGEGDGVWFAGHKGTLLSNSADLLYSKAGAPTQQPAAPSLQLGGSAQASMDKKRLLEPESNSHEEHEEWGPLWEA
jgi:hypothetical protein